MFLTGPGSSKGRRRDGGTPDAHGGSARLTGQDSLRARSQPQMQSSSHGELSPDRQPLRGASLNRFRVLPSIERGPPRTSPHGGGGAVTGPHVPEAEDGFCFQGRGDADPSAGRVSSACSSSAEGKAALSPDTLLLAIRDPGGRRFQQRFNHTDTLRRVRASAEAAFGARYGENASIETMEVPRRSFRDLSRTLSQCGIVNKSVLCIYQPQEP